MKEEIQVWLAGIIGCRLLKVIGDFHRYGNQVSENPNSIWLYFHGQQPIRILGASDGESIRLDQAVPASINMAEYGEIVIQDISAKSVFESCVDRNLQEDWTIESPIGKVIRVGFNFGKNSKPMVLNWGDELVIAVEYPAMNMKNENIFEVPVISRHSDN